MPDPNQATDWKQTLITDETLRSHPSLQTFKDVNELVKSHIALQPLVGKEKIPVPTDKDGDDIWNTVFDRLGRPKTPDEYKFPDVKLPEGFPALNPESMKKFAAKAHGMGLTSKQAAALFEYQMGELITGYNEKSAKDAEAMKATETNLRQKWGAAYDQKLKLASMVAQKFGSPELKAELENGKGNNLHLIAMLADIGANMSESVLVGRPGGEMLTPEAAQMEINRIMGDKANPYWNKQHPEHDTVVARVSQLYSFIHPDAPENQ